MAEVVWLGTASNIKQETTITVGGTWAMGETATLTINNNDLNVIVGTSTTTATVAEIIYRAVNASSATANLKDDEVRNRGGQEIPEFTDIVAEWTSGSSVVTLKSRVAGVPFTVVDSVTSTSGTLADSTTVNATGKEHWDNADNWSTGSVPVNSDSVIIDGRAAASIKYGLAQSAVTLASLTITRGFSAPKQIGLSKVRSTSAGDYAEYRNTYLAISSTAVDIGDGSGVMSGLIRLNLGSAQSTVLVYNTGSATEDNTPSLCLLGTNASNALYVFSGANVGVAFFDSEVSTFSTIDTSGVLTIGDSATITNVDVNGGSFTTRSASTTLDVLGGTATVLEGAITTTNVYTEGTLSLRATGTFATVGCGGKLVCPDPRSRTITNVLTLYKGAVVEDPYSSLTLSNGFKVSNGKLEDVDVDFGYDRTYSIS